MANEDIPQLPDGCGYQGYEFGASYPDSICVAGYLWDADNCNDKQELYQPDEQIPCPMCHPRLAERYWTEQNELNGERSFLDARKAAKSLVADIRSNRKNALVLTTRTRCVNPILGNCSAPHWLGKPTEDGKALQQTTHPMTAECKNWKAEEAAAVPGGVDVEKLAKEIVEKIFEEIHDGMSLADDYRTSIKCTEIVLRKALKGE